MNLLDSSRRLGELRAVELACFRRLGERAPRLTPASCARWASAAARAHAWRASLLESLLPVSKGLPGWEELTVVGDGPLGDELARTLPESAGAPRVFPAGGGSSDTRPDSALAFSDAGLELVADLVGRLYPLLLDGYGSHLGACTEAADGAVMRMLGRAVADLEVVRAEGSVLCQRAG